MKVRHFLLPALSASLLAACSPHPSAGKWKAISDNEFGIKDLSILFEGKAEFVTTKKDIASWHCFWGGESKTVATMTCSPSSDEERRGTYQFVVDSADQGQLIHQGKAIATFERKPYK